MIFLSHNSKDKPIVEPIAIKLKEAFGIEKVFYDSWSIQPGDGIIDKMDEGLTDTNIFFLFVSNNSLTSKMVALEWQNALMKSTSSELRFIPIRIEDCSMPSIFKQNIYLDYYNNGPDNTLAQMINIIKGKSTFTSQYEEDSNLHITKEQLKDSRIKFEISAKYYVEHELQLCFTTLNELNNFRFEIEDVFRYGFDYLDKTPTMTSDFKPVKGFLLQLETLKPRKSIIAYLTIEADGFDDFNICLKQKDKGSFEPIEIKKL